MSYLRFCILSAALLTASVAVAQTTYRWVDKSGQTVFSDLPPPPDARQVVTRSREERGDEKNLPYATRQAAEKYPVILYTSAHCLDACKQGRALLNGRGVPFSEKMMNSQEEIDALAKITGGEAAVPSLLVGTQSFKGFESSAWNNLLDLAGYPASAPYGSKPSGAFTP